MDLPLVYLGAKDTDLYYSLGRHARLQQDGEKACPRMRSFEQDMKAFLCEMVVVAEDIR